MLHHQPPIGWPRVKFEEGATLRIPDPAVLEHHSLINLLNIIGLTVQCWEMDHPIDETSQQITEKEIPAIVGLIRDPLQPRFRVIHDQCLQLEVSLHRFISKHQAGDQQQQEEVLNNLLDFALLLKMQIEDLERKWKHPTHWRRVHFYEIEYRMRSLFAAMERYAAGRYKIRFNPPLSESENKIDQSSSYTIRLESLFGDDSDAQFPIPSQLPATIQDLCANARKYSPIGSTIEASLGVEKQVITFTIQDSGIGIAPDELNKVVMFGYRGSNAENTKSYGGGYGLTKAVFLTQKYNGSLELASKLGQGTWIQIKIPVPPDTSSSTTA